MFLYNLGIYLFYVGLNLASLFNPKAKQWIEGRRKWYADLLLNIKKLDGRDIIWFHCASLGEFEQGRPVIEKIKIQFPSKKILLTFFSPSGFEIQKNYPFADVVCYLPLDTKRNATKFINTINPSMVVFIKYEFWLNYLFTLQKLNIPTFLISTVIKPHQPFFKWYGTNFRKAIKVYDTIFTQDVYSLRLLKILKIQTGILAGDTRFDRVLSIVSNPKQINEIAEFANNSFVVIAGSCWPKDEECLVESYVKLKHQYPSLKLIFAPHEINKKSIDRLCNLLHKNNLNYHLFSENLSHYKSPILIINAIGFLSSIYQYGKIAVIGGGFNDGIHNILEPTVYGLPVIFGPNHQKFNEASQILDLRAGFEYNNSDELYQYLEQLLRQEDFLNEASILARNYVRKNSGATDKIMEGLFNRSFS